MTEPARGETPASRTTAGPPTFGARLSAAMTSRGPLCVGIDPHPGLLAAWGLPDTTAGLRSFCRQAVTGLAAVAAVVKPQSAFFERHGSAGVAVLEETIAGARAAGALVLSDVKRGDIGSTMTAYAQAYLCAGAGLESDAITLSPYLGVGALTPAFELAAGSGKGVFVLALTSNPEGASVQLATDHTGTSLASAVLAELARRNAGAQPLGSLGAVVGATTGDLAERAGADLGINGPLLAPGLGAQGAGAAQLAGVFGENRHLVLPAASRSVLATGPDPDALRGAVTGLNAELRQALRPMR